MTLILTPAYGRDFKTKKAAVASFAANQDWIIENTLDPYCGKPVNIEQLEQGQRVQLRFDGKTQVAVVEVDR